jgi:hypothetical protein
MMRYRVRRTAIAPELIGAWSAGPWAEAPPLTISRFHPRSSTHHPKTQARLLFDDRFLYAIFRVEDRYVQAVTTSFQGPVWTDSCVELFVRPREDRGYFNFEMNCGGTLLLYYIEDPTRTPDGFVKYTKVEERYLAEMKVYHSLPKTVDPEIRSPLTWIVEYRVPFTLFSTYVGSTVKAAGSGWRGNLFKCAEKCSHPHWASWAPIGEEFNFHQPDRFGLLQFDA